MKILVLNGSSRPTGNTAKMVAAFKEGAEGKGNASHCLSNLLSWKLVKVC